MNPKIKKSMFCLLVLVLCQFSIHQDNAYAQKKKHKMHSMQADSTPEPVQSVTSNTVKINGKTIKYTATAGLMPIYNNLNEPIASFGYTAYTKQGVDDNTKRPIIFAYNGGPGSASIWLHMGALGPRRVKIDDPKIGGASPYELINNQYSPLDVADVVMIDPVGTGYSRAEGKKKNSYFWGLNNDISSISRFIKKYLETNNRWNSPKYLLGESYGSTRSAGIVNHLLSDGIAMNGVILLGTVLDLRTIAFGPDDMLPYAIYLPTYAAIAWHYNKVDNKPDNLKDYVDEVRKFAINEYAPALIKGNSLSDADRNQIINKLSQYTGLSKDYIDQANLRVNPSAFAKEIIHDQGKIVGRYDGRYNGSSQDALTRRTTYDPSSTAITPAFETMFLQYYHQDLGFGKDRQYMFSASGLPHFKWKWPEGRGWPTTPDTSPMLARAMLINPHLRVHIISGYYDLATPFMGSEYTVNQMHLVDRSKDKINITYVKAGHMSYLRPSALKKMHEVIDDFIQQGNQ